MVCYAYKFAVKGKLQFPIDMLRYDGCFPYNSEDAVKIANSFDPTYRRDMSGAADVVWLIAVKPRHWEPEFGRWSSFSWPVVPSSLSDGRKM